MLKMTYKFLLLTIILPSLLSSAKTSQSPNPTTSPSKGKQGNPDRHVAHTMQKVSMRQYGGSWAQDTSTILTEDTSGFMTMNFSYSDVMHQYEIEVHIYDGFYKDNQCVYTKLIAPATYQPENSNPNPMLVDLYPFESTWKKYSDCVFGRLIDEHLLKTNIKIDFNQAKEVSWNQSHWFQKFELPFSLGIYDHNSDCNSTKDPNCMIAEYKSDLAYFSEHKTLYQYILFSALIVGISFVKIRATWKLLTKCCLDDTLHGRKMSSLSILIILIWDICSLNIYDKGIEEFSFMNQMIFIVMTRFVCIMDLFLLGNVADLSNIGNMQQRSCGRRWLLGYVLGYSITAVAYRFLEYEIFKLLICCCLIPQIILNVRQQDRTAFKYNQYLFRCCASYLVLFYLQGMEQNLLDTQPQLKYLSLTLLIFAGQFTLLNLQTKYGTRFFLPRFISRLLPNEYKYLLNLQSNITTKDKESDDICSICLNNLRDSKQAATPETDAILESVEMGHDELVKTDCNHVFHAVCFVEWTRRKKDCPVCRTPIQGLPGSQDQNNDAGGNGQEQNELQGNNNNQSSNLNLGDFEDP